MIYNQYQATIDDCADKYETEHGVDLGEPCPPTDIPSDDGSGNDNLDL